MKDEAILKRCRIGKIDPGPAMGWVRVGEYDVGGSCLSLSGEEL